MYFIIIIFFFLDERILKIFYLTWQNWTKLLTLWCCGRYEHDRCMTDQPTPCRNGNSGSSLSDVPVGSPGELFIVIVWINISWIKISNNCCIYFWQFIHWMKNTGSTRLAWSQKWKNPDIRKDVALDGGSIQALTRCMLGTVFPVLYI